jgi:hypothetical protein
MRFQGFIAERVVLTPIYIRRERATAKSVVVEATYIGEERAVTNCVVEATIYIANKGERSIGRVA